VQGLGFTVPGPGFGVCWAPGAAQRPLAGLGPLARPRPRLPGPAPPPRAPAQPQAGSGAPGNLGLVKELTSHPAFNPANPNSCYSLYLAFARAAPSFHAADGSGYEFMGDAVLQVKGGGGVWGV
jgi:hypothetical protein